MLLGIVLCCVMLFAGNVYAADLQSARTWRAPDHSRFVFEFTDPVEHKVFMQEPQNGAQDAGKVVIEVPHGHAMTRFDNLVLNDTPIKKISADDDGTTLRLTFVLKEPVRLRSFSLVKTGQYRDRLVVDFLDNAPPAALLAEFNGIDPVATPDHTPLHNTAQDKITAPPSPPPAAEQKAGKRNIVIAIDAGHGGEDPGAMKNGVQEKEIVLSIAKRLAAVINEQPGYHAVLTRKGDYYIPLRDRTRLAQKMQADMFISIHADAFTNADASGSSVFALSQHGATSETARFIAQHENESDQIGGVDLKELEHVDETLRYVLADMSVTAKITSSLDVGKKVLQQLGTVSHLHRGHVEQAGFMVLKSLAMPSLLVETGFISNPDEAKKLDTPHYQKQLADAVFMGINKYFVNQPPEGTLLAMQKIQR
jgi:N-acetylmuramoyl-L-alanine amidase